MIIFSKINKHLKTIKLGGDNLVKLLDLINYLKSNNSNDIYYDSCIIVPNYIFNGKRMELFQYEFYFSDECEFEEYILNKTGKKKMEDIPDEILNRANNYFANRRNEKKLNKYIENIGNNQELIKDVKTYFDIFDMECVYVAIY